MIWDGLPKSTFVGKGLFELGVYDAAANFNMGAEATKEVLRKLQIEPGQFTSRHYHALDNSQIYYAEYKRKGSSKATRKKSRSKRKSKDDKKYWKGGYKLCRQLACFNYQKINFKLKLRFPKVTFLWSWSIRFILISELLIIEVWNMAKILSKIWAFKWS